MERQGRRCRVCSHAWEQEGLGGLLMQALGDRLSAFHIDCQTVTHNEIARQEDRVPLGDWGACRGGGVYCRVAWCESKFTVL